LRLSLDFHYCIAIQIITITKTFSYIFDFGEIGLGYVLDRLHEIYRICGGSQKVPYIDDTTTTTKRRCLSYDKKDVMRIHLGC